MATCIEHTAVVKSGSEKRTLYGVTQGRGDSVDSEHHHKTAVVCVETLVEVCASHPMYQSNNCRT